MHVVVVMVVVVLAVIFLAVGARGVGAAGLAWLMVPPVAAARRRRPWEAGKALRAAAPLVLALLFLHWRRTGRVVLVQRHQLLKDRKKIIRSLSTTIAIGYFKLWVLQHIVPLWKQSDNITSCNACFRGVQISYVFVAVSRFFHNFDHHCGFL